jgi:hypothetical protein
LHCIFFHREVIAASNEHFNYQDNFHGKAIECTAGHLFSSTDNQFIGLNYQFFARQQFLYFNHSHQRDYSYFEIVAEIIINFSGCLEFVRAPEFYSSY